MKAQTPGTASAKKRTASQVLYEKKLEANREAMRLQELRLAVLEQERSTLFQSGFMGLAVIHKTFGNGTITEQAAQIITVQFDSANKRFVLPSAFTEGFLTTTDDGIKHDIIRYRDIGEEIRSTSEQMSEIRRTIRALESKL